MCLHATWCVNSIAHFFGEATYDPAASPRESMATAILTNGEGWHSYHHKYPYDYAASEFGITSQFNPSKLFIDICARLGLVWDRKRATSAWAMSRARRDRDRAAGIPLPKPTPRPWEKDLKKAI